MSVHLNVTVGVAIGFNQRVADATNRRTRANRNRTVEVPVAVGKRLAKQRTANSAVVELDAVRRADADAPLASNVVHDDAVNERTGKGFFGVDRPLMHRLGGAVGTEYVLCTRTERHQRTSRRRCQHRGATQRRASRRVGANADFPLAAGLTRDAVVGGVAVANSGERLIASCRASQRHRAGASGGRGFLYAVGKDECH